MGTNVLQNRSGLKVWLKVLAFCAVENFDRTSKRGYFLFCTSGITFTKPWRFRKRNALKISTVLYLNYPATPKFPEGIYVYRLL